MPPALCSCACMRKPRSRFLPACLPRCCRRGWASSLWAADGRAAVPRLTDLLPVCFVIMQSDPIIGNAPIGRDQ